MFGKYFLAFLASLVLLGVAQSAIVYQCGFDNDCQFDPNGGNWGLVNGMLNPTTTFKTQGGAGSLNVKTFQSLPGYPNNTGFYRFIQAMLQPLVSPQLLNPYGQINLGPNQVVTVEYKTSFRLKGAQKHKFGDLLVQDAENDPRLGSCVVLFMFGDTAFCSAQTNTGVWGWHERFAYPVQIPPYDGSNLQAAYQGFVNWYQHGTRVSPYQFDSFKLQYDRKNHALKLWINGQLARNITNPGVWPPNDQKGVDVMLYKPLTEPSVEPAAGYNDWPGFNINVGCLAEIDKTDPNNIDSNIGLVSNNSPDGSRKYNGTHIFKKPLAWASNSDASDETNVNLSMFGQSVEFSIKDFSIDISDSV